MTTYVEVMERVAQVEDVSVWEYAGRISLTVLDFEGFDEDYGEVMAHYDEEAVASLLEWLEEHCVSMEENFYTIYYFDGFEVSVGYESYDI